MKNFSAEVSQSLSTADIMEKMGQVVSREIPIEQMYICLLEGDNYQARYCSSPLATLSFSISKDSPQIAYLKEQENYLIVGEFQNSPRYLSVWEAEKELFRRLNIDCVAAMRDGDEIVGLLLLSAKERGRNFNAVEIGFLETVSSIASIAMKNAALYEKMFREARIDPLTGVYNYRFFVEQLEEQFLSCGRECLTLMYIDVDDFKLYNQLYGVGEGDAALCRIGEVISRCTGESGIVFRTSGKVFAVLLPLQDTQRARTLAREIETRVARINQKPERQRLKPLSVSVGICSAPYAASSAKELMDNADLAVYNAKQGGKDQIVIFRGASDLVPQHLAERTDAIVDRIERGDGEYRSALSMISALTAAIDAKDHYTYAHSKNVARYAATLAVAAGLNDDQVRTIYAAGLLHDIGKISIPENILNKTGKLEDGEYRVMKDHVNNSIEMIRHLPEMDYLIPAVLGHHERWDGKGYPRGIAGEEIPVSARCLAIADVFDAMTTDRPYRRGLPLEYALEEIRKGAGTQFDPSLAKTFIQLIRSRSIPLRIRDIPVAFSLHHPRSRWQLCQIFCVPLVVLLAELAGLPRAMWAGIAAMSVILPVAEDMHYRVRRRVLGNIAGVLCFVILYFLLPPSIYAFIGVIGGIGVGLSAKYGWQAVFNTFGALAIAAEAYGLKAALGLRLLQNVFGVLFALVFCLLFSRMLARFSAPAENG